MIIGTLFGSAQSKPADRPPQSNTDQSNQAETTPAKDQAASTNVSQPSGGSTEPRPVVTVASTSVSVSSGVPAPVTGAVRDVPPNRDISLRDTDREARLAAEVAQQNFLRDSLVARLTETSEAFVVSKTDAAAGGEATAPANLVERGYEQAREAIAPDASGQQLRLAA